MNIAKKDFIEFLESQGFEITNRQLTAIPTQLYKELKPSEDCFANEIYGLYITFGTTTNVRFEFIYTAAQFELNYDGTIDGSIVDSSVGVYMGNLGDLDIMKSLYHMCFDDIINGVTDYKNYVLSMAEDPSSMSALQLISMQKEPITYLTGLYENEFNSTPMDDDIRHSLFEDEDFADDEDDDESFENHAHGFNSSYDVEDIKSRMGF